MKILRFEDAKWNVSGLFSHDAIVLKFWDILADCGLYPICGVHGAPPCKWNSGRTVIQHSEQYYDESIQEYEKRGIPVFLTFSNYLLTEEDLHDDACNQLLGRIASRPGNGVIVASPVLKTYISREYPDLFQIKSVLASVKESSDRDCTYYESQDDGFDRMVLHPDDLFNDALLESLTNKDRFEIMVNENCIRYCPLRKQHDDLLCTHSVNESTVTFEMLSSFAKQNCQMFLGNGRLGQYLKGQSVTCSLSQNRLSKVYKQGYRYFKIQGRADAPASFLYDLSRYILTSECEALVFKHICNSMSFSCSMEKLELL